MGNREKFLVFSVAGHAFALGSMSVLEILRSGKVQELPFVPPLVAGMVSYRGKPFSVIDTSLLLDCYVLAKSGGLGSSAAGATGGAGAAENVIVLNHEEEDVCLTADLILRFEMAELRRNAVNDFYKGEIKSGEDAIPVLNIERIIATERQELGYR